MTLHGLSLYMGAGGERQGESVSEIKTERHRERRLSGASSFFGAVPVAS